MSDLDTILSLQNMNRTLHRHIKKLEREKLEGWKEATIAWSVCASIHREYAKGKDPLFTTRQGDFVKHENEARAVLEKKS